MLQVQFIHQFGFAENVVFFSMQILSFVLLQYHIAKLSMNIQGPLMETSLKQDSVSASSLSLIQQTRHLHSTTSPPLTNCPLIQYVSVFRIARSPEALCAGDWDNPMEAAAFAIDQFNIYSCHLVSQLHSTRPPRPPMCHTTFDSQIKRNADTIPVLSFSILYTNLIVTFFFIHITFDVFPICLHHLSILYVMACVFCQTLTEHCTFFNQRSQL